MKGSPRAITRPSAPPAPAFPQPVPTFVGRRAELDRILAHVDREVLFLIYGVGGIGKSELAYQAIREVLARPDWQGATPVFVEIREGTTGARILADMLDALGAAPRRALSIDPAEQLSQLAALLEAQPYLVFVDDAHHAPGAEIGEALAYLARRVRKSRLFVASSRELAMPPDAPPPVVTTLGPLDRASAERMMVELTERMQLAAPEPEALMRATRGSPFHIHRLLMRGLPGTGSLDESLNGLSRSSRRVLLLAATAGARVSVEMVRRTPAGGASLDDALRELAHRFLLEVKDGAIVVHDLIREALLASVSADELAAAHGDAAEVCVAELSRAAGASQLLAVDAAHHFLSAGRAEEAWGVVERFHSALSASGNEHLLIAPLERLREALPARARSIDLLIARSLLRASLFDEASRVLSRVDGELTDAEVARHCVLLGEIAQHAGDLPRAEDLFERAATRAPDEATRFVAHLRAATAAALRANGERARQVLDAALAELTTTTPRQRARAGWTRTVSFMFDERYELAAEEARRTRREMPERGLDDLGNQLSMLETLASIECDDMEHAREAARRIDEAGLRKRVAALYRAIGRLADGNPREASTALLEAHDYLRSHGDTINAFLAGYYGSIALAEIGQLGEARELCAKTGELAERAGFRGPAARALAQQALLAAEGLQAPEAHRLADLALANEHLGPRSRALAHCAHSRGYTIEGDIARALEHVALARAAVADPEFASARAGVDVQHAAVDLVGGNLDRAVEHAERAVEHYRERSRDFEGAHALLVLSAGYIARGRPTDWLLAERTTARAREIADRAGLLSIQVGCAILGAATARRGKRDGSPHELLGAALHELDPERGSIYAGALFAAIDGGFAARVVPGVSALLAHLGFTETVEGFIVDAQGRRAATKRDIARERELHDLFVDERRSVIVGRRGEIEIAGRPMLCSMLSALVQARGAALSPELLYQRVWGAGEYHALRHRNALYVAINRLRACLKTVLPGRDVLQRTAEGWRLADDVDACVAVAVRGVAHPPEDAGQTV